MDAKTLNAALTSYILSIRRMDGSDYEVSSVHNMFSSIARYLADTNSGVDLENDPAFKSFREAKASKVKKLKAAVEKGTDYSEQCQYPWLRRRRCVQVDSSVIMNPWHSLGPCGTSCVCPLDYAAGTRPDK